LSAGGCYRRHSCDRNDSSPFLTVAYMPSAALAVCGVSPVGICDIRKKLVSQAESLGPAIRIENKAGIAYCARLTSPIGFGASRKNKALSTLASSSDCTGLVMYSSIPAAMHFSLSPVRALAVIATIGVCLP